MLFEINFVFYMFEFESIGKIDYEILYVFV